MARMVRDDDVFASRSRIDTGLSRRGMGRARAVRERTVEMAARAGTDARFIGVQHTGGTLDVPLMRSYPHAYLSANQPRPSRARVTRMKDGAP
jgi:hypothetical protein